MFFSIFNMIANCLKAWKGCQYIFNKIQLELWSISFWKIITKFMMRFLFYLKCLLFTIILMPIRSLRLFHATLHKIEQLCQLEISKRRTTSQDVINEIFECCEGNQRNKTELVLLLERWSLKYLTKFRQVIRLSFW